MSIYNNSIYAIETGYSEFNTIRNSDIFVNDDGQVINYRKKAGTVHTSLNYGNDNLIHINNGSKTVLKQIINPEKKTSNRVNLLNIENTQHKSLLLLLNNSLTHIMVNNKNIIDFAYPDKYEYFLNDSYLNSQINNKRKNGCLYVGKKQDLLTKDSEDDFEEQYIPVKEQFKDLRKPLLDYFKHILEISFDNIYIYNDELCNKVKKWEKAKFYLLLKCNKILSDNTISKDLLLQKNYVSVEDFIYHYNLKPCYYSEIVKLIEARVAKNYEYWKKQNYPMEKFKEAIAWNFVSYFDFSRSGKDEKYLEYRKKFNIIKKATYCTLDAACAAENHNFVISSPKINNLISVCKNVFDLNIDNYKYVLYDSFKKEYYCIINFEEIPFSSYFIRNISNVINTFKTKYNYNNVYCEEFYVTNNIKRRISFSEVKKTRTGKLIQKHIEENNKIFDKFEKVKAKTFPYEKNETLKVINIVNKQEIVFTSIKEFSKLNKTVTKSNNFISYLVNPFQKKAPEKYKDLKFNNTLVRIRDAKVNKCTFTGEKKERLITHNGEINDTVKTEARKIKLNISGTIHNKQLHRTIKKLNLIKKINEKLVKQKQAPIKGTLEEMFINCYIVYLTVHCLNKLSYNNSVIHKDQERKRISQGFYICDEEKLQLIKKVVEDHNSYLVKNLTIEQYSNLIKKVTKFSILKLTFDVLMEELGYEPIIDNIDKTLFKAGRCTSYYINKVEGFFYRVKILFKGQVNLITKDRPVYKVVDEEGNVKKTYYDRKAKQKIIDHIYNVTKVKLDFLKVYGYAESKWSENYLQQLIALGDITVKQAQAIRLVKELYRISYEFVFNIVEHVKEDFKKLKQDLYNTMFKLYDRYHTKKYIEELADPSLISLV